MSWNGIESLPVIGTLFSMIRRGVGRILRRRRLARQTPAEIFSEKYRNNSWRGECSVSGQGSDPCATRAIVARLPELLRYREIESLVDVPCGDFAWMREIDLSGIEYTGGDIVDELIESNNEQYADSNLRFRRIDLLSETVPAGDLLICRDCLVHFSYADIWRAMTNIVASNVTYALLTNFPDTKANHDILTGEWRPLNLELPPFEFPTPLERLEENPPGDKFQDKSLGLWRIAELQAVVSRHKSTPK